MPIIDYERIAIAIFEEQVVEDNTIYYTDILPLNEYGMINFHITSSGTVDGIFTLETRSRPAPAVGVWANQDDGYWFTRDDVTISGAQGYGDKQNDDIQLANVNSAQVRVKMSIASGGTLGLWTTLK